MRTKKRNITVYSDGKNSLHTELTVHVDDAGEEWLAPEQVDYLETASMLAKYELGNTLKATKKLIHSFVSPPPEVSPVVVC